MLPNLYCILWVLVFYCAKFHKNLSQYEEFQDILQGAKRVNFPACPLGKLELTSTSPKVIFTSPKNFFGEQNEKNIN